MKRILAILLFLLPVLAFAQTNTNPLTNVFYISADGDCTNDPCSIATSRRQMCRNTSTDLHAYMCDTSTGFYTAMASAATPAGSTTQIQFNDAAAFAGDSGLTYDKTTDILSAGGLNGPLSIKRDFTLPNPTVAPTAASNAGLSGSYLAARTYRHYIVWASVSGITNLSPASTPDLTPTNLKAVTVTRSESVPSGALGWVVFWSSSFDGFAAKHVCKAGGYSVLLVASGTTTYDCLGQNPGTPPDHPGTNATGVRIPVTFETLGDNIIGLGTTGTTVGSATQDVRRLDYSGTNPKWSSDSGSSYKDIYLAPVGTVLDVNYSKTVTICAGTNVCDYTTLDAACAAETSTAAAPILYWIKAGVYSKSGQISCSGEDSAAIIGDGMAVTVLENTDTSAGVVLNIGNSKNMTIANLSLKGDSGMRMDPAGAGGGFMVVRNVDFAGVFTASGGQDCILMGGCSGGFIAGSEVYLINNICRTGQDGFTFLGTPPDAVYSIGNVFTGIPGAGEALTSRISAWSLFSLPCRFRSIGDIFDQTFDFNFDHSANGFTGYLFEGDNAASCAATNCSGAVAEIKDATINLKDDSSNIIVTQANGIRVKSTATALTRLNVSGATIDINVSTATSNGTARGILVENATTQVNLKSSRIRTDVGTASSEVDLDGNTASKFLVQGSDWMADDGNLTNYDTEVKCAVITDLAAADDNFEFWMADRAVTIKSVGCRCRGTCSTMATLTLEDRGGNAMTITGTNPTCATTGNATYAAVTAANGLVAGEGIAFDVTNTPNPETDEYTICVTYTVDKQ